jgi:GT2 family glycosyltransferase
MINLCVPTLNRYDMLARLIASALASDPRPDKIWVIDNGRNVDESFRAVITPSVANVPVHVHTPHANLGVAASWNWFLRNVPEERVIANDDVVLAPGSLARLIGTPGLFVSPLAGAHQAFSCFLIRDECVKRVGFFDEKISPGYAYFEDVDYAWRMAEVNIPIQSVVCGIEHAGSQTLASYTPEQLTQHHRRFIVAQKNFEQKWGRLPGPKQRFDQ